MDEELKKSIENQIQSFSKKIDFYISEYTVEILANKVRQNEYTVPKYQREFVWDEPRKSKFIESLIMGLPIPFIFFWENDETGKLEIVDGSQRLRTLEEYLSGKLVLDGLERLVLLNKTTFFDLEESRQRKINNKSIRGIILSENTELESRIDLFERINTGSKVAEPVEVRRGALQGPFMDFINSLAEDKTFNSLAPVSGKQKKAREREELISRFFAYGDGLDDYKDDVSPFLFRYIKKMNDEFLSDNNLKDEYQKRFDDTLKFVKESFEFGFRKSVSAKTTPRARFEALAIGSYLAIQKNPMLSVSFKDTAGILKDENFIAKVRSDGANAKSKLNGRISFVRDALLGV